MISSPAAFAGLASQAIEEAYHPTTFAKRTGIESIHLFTKNLTEGLAKSRWTKRAAIGMMAFSILDPNTNSILLPDQRGRGEEYDIPSLAELSRGYRRDSIKLRSDSPILADKILDAAGLPVRFGTAGRVNRYVPPIPTKHKRVYTSRRKDGPGDLHELSRQIGGLIRQ